MDFIADSYADSEIPFSQRWEKMKPVVGSLLKQEDVSKSRVFDKNLKNKPLIIFDNSK